MNSLRMKNTKVCFYAFLAFALICLAAFFPVTAFATTYTVDPDGGSGGDYATIQAAIDDAAVVDSDILSLSAGTYTITSPISVDKSITIQGAGAGSTTIAVGGTLTYMIDILDSLTGVTITDLTMDGSGYDVQRGISAQSPLTVDSVTIQDISHSTATVIGIYALEDTTLTDLTMSNIGRFGIYASAATAGSAINLNITRLDYTGKNSASLIDYAIDVADGVHLTLADSSIVDCSGTPGIYASTAIIGSTASGAPATTSIAITNTDFSNNYINVALGLSAAENGTTASASGCDFNIASGGYNIDSYSSSALDFQNNYWNMTSATAIADTFNFAGSGTVDYNPYYMDAAMTVSSDDFLGSLVFSAGTLSPAFDSGVYTYTLTVPYASSSVTVTPTALGTGATITVNGTAVTSGSASGAISLTAGADTAITVVVNSTTTYTITAHRQTSYRLSALTVSQGGGGSAITLSPTFNSDTLAYTFVVSGSYTTIDIAATAEDASATVTGTGTSLALTGSPFTVACQSSEGVTQNYVITAVYPSSDASLDSILYNGSEISGFAPTTYTYAQTVSNAITSVTLSAITADAGASYTINGAAPASSYAVAVGTNTFTILVTAQDGSTTHTYTVTVTREAAASTSSNANLSDLRVDGYTVFLFDPATTEYFAIVAAGATTATVTATAEDSGATITGTGVVTLSAMGITTVDVIVHAADGTTTKTYSILIVESEPSAELIDLSIDGETVAGFQYDIYSYAATVTTSTVTISALAYDSGATITGTGLKTLNYGVNVFTISVTSSDGAETNNYLLTITRGGSHDATLSGITVNGVSVSRFDPKTYYYFAYVDYSSTTATIAATPTVTGATVTGTGTYSIAAGETVRNVKVTAPDGTTTATYHITIVRPLSTWPHLKDLSVGGLTVDKFAYNSYEYVVTLASNTETVLIGATPMNTTTTVTGTGRKALVRGGNDFVVKATSSNGTVRKYNLTIFRGYLKNAKLDNITINGKEISDFSATDTYYTVTVPYSTKGFTFWGEPQDDYASVSGNGWKNLSVGKNTLKLVVTADDNATTKTYTVVVTRKSSSTSSTDTDDDDDDSDTSTTDTDTSTTDTSTTDTDTSTTDTDTSVVVNPTSEVDVTENLLLKDTQNTMDGTTYVLIVDDDAFQEAIKNALAKKKVEEGDGTNGILAHPYVSFPKANSIDANASVRVELDGETVQSAFNQDVGLILTLDYYTIVMPAAAFSTDLVDDKLEDYLISKRVLTDDEAAVAAETLLDGREVLYASEVAIGYTTENGQNGTQKSFDKAITVSIVGDPVLKAAFDSVTDIADIELFIEDATSGGFMKVNYQYDSVNGTLQFSARALGKIIITKKAEASATSTPTPTSTTAPVDNSSKKGLPAIVIVMIIGSVILGVAIIFLATSNNRRKRGSSRMDDGGDINI